MTVATTGCIEKRLRSKMGVTLRHARLRVPQQVLHDIERYALVDQETRERVAQIVETDVIQSSPPPNAAPLMMQRPGRSTRHRRRENILVIAGARHRFQYRHCSAIERDGPRLPDLATGTSNVRRCQSTCSHLAW
jgi:hypothetical protein